MLLLATFGTRSACLLVVQDKGPPLGFLEQECLPLTRLRSTERLLQGGKEMIREERKEGATGRNETVEGRISHSGLVTRWLCDLKQVSVSLWPSISLSANPEDWSVCDLKIGESCEKNAGVGSEVQLEKRFGGRPTSSSSPQR